MADQFTETTNQSWGSRLGNSIKGVIFGFILFLAGFPLLFWNEGRAVTTFKSLAEGASSVLSLPADPVNPANEGKLIHTSGVATTTDVLTDPLFGVTAKAIKLRRSAEMYQWKEESHAKTEKKLGGGEETITTYTYQKVWSDTRYDSANFKQVAGHENPAMKTKSEELLAKNVTLGAFTLAPKQISRISGGQNLSVTNEQISLSAKAAFPNLRVEQGGIYLGSNLPNQAIANPVNPVNPATPNPALPQTVAPVVVNLSSSANPQVGDLRITYQQVLPTTISVVARQVRQTFEPYMTKAGGEVDLLEMGEISAANMFAAAQTTNQYMTWGLRALGFLLMFIGMSSIFKPLSVLADVVPFIGSLVGVGTSVVAFFISAFCSLMTIAIAWLASRPLLGIALLIVSAGLAVGLFTLAKKKPQIAKN